MDLQFHTQHEGSNQLIPSFENIPQLPSEAAQKGLLVEAIQVSREGRHLFLMRLYQTISIKQSNFPAGFILLPTGGTTAWALYV